MIPVDQLVPTFQSVLFVVPFQCESWAETVWMRQSATPKEATEFSLFNFIYVYQVVVGYCRLRREMLKK